MSPRPPPGWPLPVMALGQIYIGMWLVTPLREPAAPWDLGYAMIAES